MIRHRSVLQAFVLAILLALPVSIAWAGGFMSPPLAINGPRLSPPVVPATSDDLLTLAPLTANALEADAFDGGRTQEAPGRGVRQTITGLGAGLTLYDTPHVCNNFNSNISWASHDGRTDIWTDWHSGWAPFALDADGYSAQNVVFARERIVGPGNRSNDGTPDQSDAQYSAKIAGSKPYAGGFGSPRIPVPAGYEDGQVMVSVKYLIWDHDQGAKLSGGDGIDYDWASMGVKPGADGPHAYYQNGYVRGEWAEMINTVDLEGAQDIMVLLQAQSPAYLNSNIFYDDVKIAFTNSDGAVKWLQDCTAEEAIR
ncbi:MAG: hypothetical protein WDZ49_08025 [Litorilinea sp.]